MTSDRGAQFTSSLWKHMSELLGSELSYTTAYHPQSNGMVERFHRRLKEALKSRLNDARWINQLPWVLLGLRTTVKEDIGASPAEMVYGSAISIPGEFLPATVSTTSEAEHIQQLRDIVGNLKPTPTSHHQPNQLSPTPGTLTAEYVFLRRDMHRGPLVRPYDGPFKVINHGEKLVKIQVGNRTETVSIDRCKPAHLDPTEDIPSPTLPRRGRPPRQPP